jgi:predicted DNA-binding transcriptional regulator AlpA
MAHRAEEGQSVTREAHKYLDEAALAHRLGVSRRTLQRWRAEGGGPPYVRLGPRRVAYDEAASDAWVASRSYTSRAAELATTA